MGLPSAPRLLVLHTIRLKGLADADVIARDASLDPDVVRSELDELDAGGLVRMRRGRISGYALTPEGRQVGAAMLDEELDSSGARDTVAGAYREFLGFNDQLLAVCTAWQLRPVEGEARVNDHADEAYDREVHDRLRALHGRVVPVLDTLTGALDRFSGHTTRLGTALERVLAGDHDWFTKPMFPSYHSVWFELHEDLLATLGTERATEPAMESEAR